MNRSWKIGLLIAGIVFGFSWGAYRVAARAHHAPELRRHMAELCVRAALGEDVHAIEPSHGGFHRHRYARIRNEVVRECTAAGKRLQAHR